MLEIRLVKRLPSQQNLAITLYAKHLLFPFLYALKRFMIDFWTDTLGELAQIVNPDLMETWFAKIRCVDVSETDCLLELETDFTRDWVKNCFGDLIEDAVARVAGHRLVVTIQSEEEVRRRENPAPADTYDYDHFESVAELRRPLADQPGPTHNPDPQFAPVLDTALNPIQPVASPTESLDVAPEASVDALDLKSLQQKAVSLNLNPTYTFDEFVVGPSNKLIAKAVQAVACRTRTYNPLFIYGNVGLGKTHLLHAVGNHMLAADPTTRIVATSAEAFMNDMIHSIRDRGMNQFRSYYRSQCDLLLIDDIQFLVGKESTQGEFFHTFNALHQAGKQIVLTSDTNPRDLHGLDDRLTNRFAWGLSIELQAPCFETRLAIVNRKASNEGIELPEEVAGLLAERIQSSIRELEGALIFLEAQSSLTGIPITIAYAEQMLKRMGVDALAELTVGRIIDTVAAHFGIRSEEILGNRRPRRISIPRQIAMYLARELTEESFPQIGEFFGGKDHTTVMTAHKKFGGLINKGEDPLIEDIRELRGKLGGGPL